MQLVVVLQNRSERWLKNDMRTKDALSNAKEAASEIRDYWDSDEVQHKVRKALFGERR